MSDYRGRFLWYELLTTDPGNAIDFYGKVAGWDTEDWEGGDQPYTMWTTARGPVGGVMTLPEEAGDAPPHWLAYIGTPDIDGTIERAGELGASVVMPTLEVPEVGRMAILADPQGAMFAVYQPENAPEGEEEPAAEGQFSWHELATSDWQAAWSFYAELFGWEKTDAVDMGEGNMYQMFGRPGGFPLGGMFDRPPEMPVSAWTVYVKVPDADAAAETVRAAGGQVLNGPMEVPGGDMIVQCTDPQGAMFAVHAAGSGEEA